MNPLEGELRFAPMREDDLPMVAQWRSRPHVARWFHGSLTPEETTAKFRPRITGAEPVRVFIVHAGDSAVGYIQEFRVGDVPAAAAALQVAPDARGVDVLIGDEAHTGRGLGTRIVRAFTDQLLQRAGVAHVVIAPDVDNAAAIRCYEKAGFRKVRTVPSTLDSRTNLLMERHRLA